jgi:hypothetical protein
VYQVLQDAETLDQMRFMFLALTTFTETTYEDFEIPTEVALKAQAIFVDQRQKEFDSDGKTKTDDGVFHRYLTLARYLSVTKGEINLKEETYIAAKAIEDERAGRIEKIEAHLQAIREKTPQKAPAGA